ncbi:hypothetical protein IL252_03500 [Halomicrobium sp. IBSBa]|uniref:hypothetical protein n=1 Tax=Halomicrobium sp. IBSBa TaxID=2778916 RepID=UPI001ABF7E95|nr:hypothetical protein [Halomicrobium sp. IBSBa]MBO4246884.1 hypothetical protein [Halomicrobium sp. IBSBa]
MVGSGQQRLILRRRPRPSPRKGGLHDVVAETDHEIDSRRTDEQGFTYAYVYDGPMSTVHIDYDCSTHREKGMRGVIAVGDGAKL